MAFSLSPSVEVRETDLTTVTSQVSISAAGIAGFFAWGEIGVPILVSSEDNLVKLFGKPKSTQSKDWHTAADFLSYGNRLRVVRVVLESEAKNASADGTGILVKNSDHYFEQYADGSADKGAWIAKYAGVLGNGIKVSICSRQAYSQSMTVTTVGTAMTGTDFVNKLSVGSIVRNAAGDERKVVTVTDATNAVLDSAFTADLTGASVTVLWEYYKAFSSAPGTSAWASNKNSVDDEVHVIVTDGNGMFTGIRETVLEKYEFLSLDSTARKEDGSSNYYAQVINDNSRYVLWGEHIGANWGTDVAATTYTAVLKPTTNSLAGGDDGEEVTDADYVNGFSKFSNAEQIDISFAIVPGLPSAVANHVIQNVCEVRKDCVAIISPEMADVVANSGSEVADVSEFFGNFNSSYGFSDCGWYKKLDRYNNSYVWVPLSGGTAGIMTRSDTTTAPWYSPAGYNRGIYKNIVKLAWSPDKAERDDLYPNSINPVIAEQGSGVVLLGDRTLLKKPSAFRNINVRRLFIVLAKSISTMAKFSLFEINDEFTRLRFKNIVEPYLRDVKGRRGIYDFYVKCDGTNNTGEVIDRNEFVADIFIKPARSINFIQLNFVATRTDADFSEFTDVQF